MICTITLYEVGTNNISAFASAFDLDGPWHQISSRQPGFLYTNLLRRSNHLLFFLVQEFWESERDYMNSESNDEVYSFRKSLRSLAACQQSLGTFRFRDQWEQELNDDHTYRKPTELRNWQMD
jgi:hypothetical protein